jgi:hypothetical protein
MFFWIFILFIWNLLGSLGVGMIIDSIFLEGNMWDIMNPYRVRQNSKVNWFGAVIVSLLCTVLCPVWALCYWFYFLCTIGRK